MNGGLRQDCRDRREPGPTVSPASRIYLPRRLRVRVRNGLSRSETSSLLTNARVRKSSPTTTIAMQVSRKSPFRNALERRSTRRTGDARTRSVLAFVEDADAVFRVRLAEAEQARDRLQPWKKLVPLGRRVAHGQKHIPMTQIKMRHSRRWHGAWVTPTNAGGLKRHDQ
jgi:hypothetical protein